MRHIITILIVAFLAACSHSKAISKTPPTSEEARVPDLDPAFVPQPITEGMPFVHPGRSRDQDVYNCEQLGGQITLVGGPDQLCFTGEWQKAEFYFSNNLMTLEGEVAEFWPPYEDSTPYRGTHFLNLMFEAQDIDPTIDLLEPLKFKAVLYGRNGQQAVTEFVVQPFTTLMSGVLVCDEKKHCERVKVITDPMTTLWVEGDGRGMDVIWPYDVVGGHQWGKPEKMADGKLYTPFRLIPPKNLEVDDHHIWISPHVLPRDEGVHFTPCLECKVPADFFLRVR